ncbi:GOLPH3/VPS74 family protein [Actinoplanes derwentensis]|uniref:Golgi phosphoprotein 3 (GPP34) n=1 Tax=Actinoplanes derwentensis TaxID=113562 RepID=A0A1H2B6M2_9ACTN|nr:GPP34 family phosphoprotein [Actinoplanes derwentensis]SDT53436.1 Golgi phosphoprotein 3 (GPP34) [Actinoplanes derwentensis]
MLLVEDLLLLLMDDETGTPAGAGTLPYTLGGAVLVELALLGRVDTTGAGGFSGEKVIAVEGEPLADPLLRQAYEKVAEKPRGVQTLLLQIGGNLWNDVVDRLVGQGLVRRESRKVLGLFRTTRLPAADGQREQETRDRIRAVLVDGAEPDTRTAALIALLSASGALPALRPQLAWSTPVIKRAKELEQGNWGASAVNTAVARTAAAIATSSAVVAVTVITTTS